MTNSNPFADPEFGKDPGAAPAKANPFSDPEFGKEPKRSWGEAAADVGVGLLQGGAGLVKSAGDLYGVASGDMGNVASTLGERGQEHWQEKKSDALQAKERQRKANIDAQDSTLGKAWSAVKDTVTDPALAVDTVATNVGTLLPSMAAGRGVAAWRLAQGARAAEAAGLSGEAAHAAAQAVAKSAGTAGTAAAIGAGALQQAADVSSGGYDEALKKPEAVWDANPPPPAAPAQAVTDAAHQAATSPRNDLPAPSDAQKEAGNYKKGHVTVNGHDISIENPAGTQRNPAWPALKNHYGYIKGTLGHDKDHVDVFLTDRAHDASLPVFVVDQNHKDGRFDEHKVIMGAADEAQARKTYLDNYAKGWKGLAAITRMTQDEFKAWVRDPAKTSQRAASGNLTSTAAQQREEHKKAEARRTASGNRLRADAWEKNPFRAFLGKHGVALDQAREFAPGKTERNKAMVQGYGPIFRRRGKQLDMLAQAAVEDGFLIAPDVAKLHAMIADALNGRRIIPQFAESVAEQEMQGMIEHHAQLEQDAAQEQNAEVEADAKAEREAIQNTSELSDAVVFDLADGLVAASNTSTEDFLRALGASEQEIADEVAKERARAQKDHQGHRQPDEAATGPAPGDSGERAAPTRPGPSDEGLNGERPAAPFTHVNGDRAEYTGQSVTLHGGLFYEVEFTEGAKQGQQAVTQRAPDGTNPGQSVTPPASGIVTPQIVPAPQSLADSAPTFTVQLEAGQNTLHTNAQFQEAQGLAKTLPRGQYARVVIERAASRTNAPAEPTRYGAWVSNGDGTATFVQKTFPASRDALTRSDIAALHAAETKDEQGRQEKMAAANKARMDAIEAKGLAAGTSWAGAQNYVYGKPGLTTFAQSTITGMDAAGFLTVDSTLRGTNRIYRFTVDAHSRLFDNYPAPDALTAPTKEDVLAQQERATQADKKNAATTAPKPDAKIEDFGQKLEGARKDYATLLKDAQGVDIGKEPLSRSWPEPDYQKLLDAGADPFVVAWAHAARDEVPTKPVKSWKLKGWTEQVAQLRDVTAGLLDGSIKKDDLMQRLYDEKNTRVRFTVGCHRDVPRCQGLQGAGDEPGGSGLEDDRLSAGQCGRGARGEPHQPAGEELLRPECAGDSGAVGARHR